MSGAAPDLAGLSREPSTTAVGIPPPASRWKSRILLPAMVLAGFLALFLYVAGDALTPKVEVSVVPVVVKSGGASGSVVAQAAGWVEPDPYPIYVSALTDGVVDEVLVLEGEVVEKGQVVVRMVADDARLALERAEARVAELTASLAASQAVLTAARTDWENPVERVRAVGVGEANVAESQADLRTVDAETVAQTARTDEVADLLRREEKQLSAGAVTEFDVIKTRLRLSTARAVLDALREKRPAVAAQVREAQAKLTAARENLRLRVTETRALAEAKAAVDRAKARVDDETVRRSEAKLRLDRMDVRAPSAGLVMHRLAAPGAKLMLRMDGRFTAHAVHLYDPARLQIRVDVPLADAAGVGVGQKAEIVVEVLPDRTFDGVVTRFVHTADIQKNTLQVKVAVKDPAAELKPEMLARVRFLGSGTSRTVEKVFALERLLENAAGERAEVWIVDKGEGRAVRRQVTVGGGRSEGWIEVLSGLHPGDVLIDGAPADLEDGDRIEIVGESPAGGR